MVNAWMPALSCPPRPPTTPCPQLHSESSTLSSFLAHPLSWLLGQWKQLCFKAYYCHRLPFSHHFKILKGNLINRHDRLSLSPSAPQAQGCPARAQSSSRGPGVCSTIKTAPCSPLAQAELEGQDLHQPPPLPSLLSSSPLFPSTLGELVPPSLQETRLAVPKNSIRRW